MLSVLHLTAVIIARLSGKSKAARSVFMKKVILGILIAGLLFTGFISSCAMGGDEVPTYRVIFHANNGTDETYEQTGFTYGESKKLKPFVEMGFTTPEGKTFLGWSEDRYDTNPPYVDKHDLNLSPATDEVHLYAIWKNIEFKITFHQNGASGSPPAPIVVPYGSDLEFPYPDNLIAPTEEQIFSGWNQNAYGEGKTWKIGEAFTPTGDTVFYAIWIVPDRQPWIVTYISEGVAVATRTVLDGDIAPSAITAPPKTGHTFVHWCDADDLLAPYNFSTPVKANISLYAKWTANTLTISYDGGGSDGGSAPAGPVSALYGNNVTMPDNTYTRTGYTFNKWSVSGQGSLTGTYAEKAVVAVSALSSAITAGDANITLTATWNPIPVISVNLDKTTLNLTVGDISQPLVPIFNPLNPANKNVVWSTNAASVATVNNGVVTATGKGAARITVTTSDGNKTAFCDITVKQKVTLYSAGYYISGSLYACYYVNGVRQILTPPDGSTDCSASSIAVADNGDIYVAGSYYDSSDNEFACYWKNGTPVKLSKPSGSNGSYSSGIAVSGNTVYISGVYSKLEGTEYKIYPCYWIGTNSYGLLLPSVQNAGFTDNLSIVANGSTAWFTGNYVGSDSWFTSAACWSNEGKRLRLSWGNTFLDEAKAITESNGLVYIAGYRRQYTYFDYEIDGPTVWMCPSSLDDYEGSVQSMRLNEIDDSGFRFSEAHAISVSGSNIYTAGKIKSYDEQSGYVSYYPCYWINKNIYTFSGEPNRDYLEITSISLSGTDVYIAGYYHSTPSGSRTLCYWENGVRKDFIPAVSGWIGKQILVIKEKI